MFNIKKFNPFYIFIFFSLSLHLLLLLKDNHVKNKTQKKITISLIDSAIKLPTTTLKQKKTLFKKKINEQKKILKKKLVHSSIITKSINEEIQNALQYPRLALQMGWEGKVRVKVDFSENKKINEVSLIQSSGYKILDENIISTLFTWNFNQTSLRNNHTQLVLDFIYSIK